MEPDEQSIWTKTGLYGLKPEVVSSVQDVFKTFPQIGKVILYGSRAKGSYQNGSDIDLTLVAAEGHTLDLSVQFQIEEDLEELMLPYQFDISILDNIHNPKLLDHIKRVGIVFYTNTAV